MAGGDRQAGIVHVFRPAACAHRGGRVEDGAVHMRDDRRLPGPHLVGGRSGVILEPVADADPRRQSGRHIVIGRGQKFVGIGEGPEIRL